MITGALITVGLCIILNIVGIKVDVMLTVAGYIIGQLILTLF